MAAHRRRIKRDPYGRTARQVEEVLESTRPYGVSKALSEVLTNAPGENLEANERAEVARQIRLLLEPVRSQATGVRLAHRCAR